MKKLINLFAILLVVFCGVIFSGCDTVPVDDGAPSEEEAQEIIYPEAD